MNITHFFLDTDGLTMGIGKYIGENLMLWMIIGIIILLVFMPLLRRFRNLKLLKTVTSLTRGTKTERNLVLKLLKHGIPAQTIFHDLCLKRSNDKFSQIDVALATTEGIIVFEVKDYSGWIFGNGNYSHWTKVLAYGKRKYGVLSSGCCKKFARGFQNPGGCSTVFKPHPFYFLSLEVSQPAGICHQNY